MGVGSERSKARPPASWPRPLTKSLNSPSRLGHLGEFLSQCVCLCVCVFLEVGRCCLMGMKFLLQRLDICCTTLYL